MLICSNALCTILSPTANPRPVRRIKKGEENKKDWQSDIKKDRLVAEMKGDQQPKDKE
jgi:hypothetical protein